MVLKISSNHRYRVTSRPSSAHSLGSWFPLSNVRRRRRITLDELALVPVWIGQSLFAGFVESGDLFGRKRPLRGAEVLPELFFIARAYDHARNGRLPQEPVQRNVGNCPAGLSRNGVDGIDDPIQPLLVNRRPHFRGRLQPAFLREGLSPTDLPRETTPSERTPDHRADSLVERKRHEFPLVVTTDQRVIRLMRDVLRPSVALRRRERLHQMPAGEIGAGDVADLAAARQRVQCIERLLDRRERVETMHVVDVDVIDSEPPQACVTSSEQMMTRRAGVIRAFAESKGRLGRNQEVVALALYGLAENFLGKSIRVDVSRIEDVDASVKAEADEALGLLNSGGSPGLEKFRAPSESPRS